MKIIGIIIISFCCCLSGILYAKKEKQRLDILCEVEKLIRFMVVRISDYRQEIFGIFADFESKLLDDCGFSSALCQSWEKAIMTLSCPPVIQKELVLLGDGLGMKNSQDQIECCQRCLKAIEGYIAEEKRTLHAKLKIYICLGFSIGAVILIIAI